MHDSKAFLSWLGMGIAGLIWIGFLPGIASAEGDWFSKIKLKGDLRYRFESGQTETATITSHRDRQMLRARLGATAGVADNLRVNLRLCTGGMEQISANETLGDYFTRDSFDLDLANAEYAPFPFLTVFAGKMENPFERVGKNQLMWSADVNPEGLAGLLTLPLASEIVLFGNLGGFWLLENSADVDAMLYAGQAGVRAKLPWFKLTAGGGYSMTRNLKNAPLFLGKSFGNSSSGGAYRYDFRQGEGFVELEASVAGWPVRIFDDFVVNNDTSEQNVGYLAGLIFNKAKAANSWEVEYNYRRVEMDSVLGLFSDTSFIGGGTNGQGHYASARYMITESVRVNANFYRAQKNIHAERKLFSNLFQLETTVTF